ncbi:hypothetical protein NX059_007068 [Plenodomus lindquistii]|nr:hypothetical protein NX059_007068 [Plenodomus lindquistii]
MFGGDAEIQLRIIEAATAVGVQRFMPHEFGQDTLNKEVQRRIVKYAGRFKVIKHLQNQYKEGPILEWVGLATGYTLDTNLISGSLGFDMEWHSATIHGIGTEPFAVSSLHRVGQAVVRVVQNWDDVKNQYLYTCGTITSANEILRSAEKVTRREWTVGNYDVEECIREGEARIAKGYPDSGMFLLDRSILYDELLDASGPFRSRSANEVLHLSMESVEEIVQIAYHDLKHHGKPGCGCSA